MIEEADSQQPEQHREMTQTPRGNETILLVDDEDYLRDLGRRMLTKFGYTVLTAPDGETAVQVYREQATANLPGYSGSDHAGNWRQELSRPDS